MLLYVMATSQNLCVVLDQILVIEVVLLIATRCGPPT
jgi:hypothetical protein